MKYAVIVSDAERFLSGRSEHFYLDPVYEGIPHNIPNSWVVVGHIDLEIEVNRDDLTKTAIKNLEEQERHARIEHEQMMDRFKDRKSQLLALAAPEGEM